MRLHVHILTLSAPFPTPSRHFLGTDFPPLLYWQSKGKNKKVGDDTKGAGGKMDQLGTAAGGYSCNRVVMMNTGVYDGDVDVSLVPFGAVISMFSCHASAWQALIVSW